MFCQGLGDCFLITVPQGTARPYSILIDCGVAKGTSGQRQILSDVVKKIADLTRDPVDGKSVIDVLAVTHEHLDHVSGFAIAATEFAQIAFKNIWFAWTEDPADPLAKELNDVYGKAKAALQDAHAKLSAMHDDDGSQKRRLAALDGVLAFHGFDPLVGAKGRPGDLETAMTKLRQWAKNLKVGNSLRYLKPGENLNLPGADPASATAKMRVHVLGPPRDKKKIIRINPSKKTPETYEKEKKHAAAAGVFWSWTAAVSSDDDAHETVEFERSQPFDGQWRLRLDQAEKWEDSGGNRFFHKRYFRNGPENRERRIDSDWLWSGAQRLALHLESYTNNTSLVLAFELPNSKDILLFAADAQVGNWLSWHDQSYESSDGERLTCEDLLARTVVYKVGHHGSHNATLRERGLELMTHPELTALLPVEAEAVERLGYGEMPVASLIRALDDQCDGRVLRLDKASGKRGWNARISGSASKEKIAAGKSGRKRPLYLQCVVRD